MEPPVLHTPRLIVRAFAEEDIEDIYLASQDPDIQRWTTIPVPFLREHAENLVREIYPRGWVMNTHRILGSFHRESGALVSTLTMTSTGYRVFEIGYWTSKTQRGHGYTVEGLDAFVRWIFLCLRAQRIEWQGIVGNPGSFAVAEKVGFRMEGTVRARVNQRGTILDADLAGLLPADLGLPLLDDLPEQT
ncbi:MAG TPA: GNAT family N-acetyltransferase [Pseudonocardiaceae bacterium]|nr:GNAT family N-acetyltransferase [Pseudonocardiaceae bacterium]